MLSSQLSDLSKSECVSVTLEQAISTWDSKSSLDSAHMYQIILLSGSRENKADYVAEIIKGLPNCVYLNINHLYFTFGKPLAENKLEEKFAERIKKPSHEVLLNFARSNMKLAKIAILDGDYDTDLLFENLPKIFNKNEKPYIRTIHFKAGELSNLETNSKNYLYIATTRERTFNNKSIKEFLSDIDLAEQKSKKNGLLVMSSGLAGSGKTTLLEPVVKSIHNFCYFDSDIPTIPFLIGHSITSDHYGQYVKNPRYECVLNFAIDNIIHGKNALIDGCFGDKITSPLMRAAFATPGVIPTVVYCHCTGETQKNRIIARGAERDREKLKDLLTDRRNNIEKHLVEFAQTNHLLYINTEDKSKLSANIQKFISYINSPDFKPTSIRIRTSPLDKMLCAISKEEAQGGLDEFKLILNGIKLRDYLAQKGKEKITFLSEHKHMTLNRSTSLPVLYQQCRPYNVERIEKIITLAEKHFKTGQEVNKELVVKLQSDPLFVKQLYKSEQFLEFCEGKRNHAWLQFEDNDFKYCANKIENSRFIAGNGPRNIKDLDNLFDNVVFGKLPIEHIICIGNVTKSNDFFDYYNSGLVETEKYCISSKIIENNKITGNLSFTGYMISDLTITNKLTGEVRHVKVNNFMVPDNGAIDLSHLIVSKQSRVLDILLELHRTALIKPLFVHCKYGVGRTGFIIFLLKLFEKFENVFKLNDDVTVAKNIHNILCTLRKNRPALVTELSQYKTAIKGALALHKYLLNLCLMSPDRELKINDSGLQQASRQFHLWHKISRGNDSNRVDERLNRSKSF